MRDAARALDDVSDHLGEVLRRADQLLVEWSGFGAQVRAQVEREAAAIGTAVDGAVARAAGAGLDQAIADRLRALTAELERLEQRTRAVSHAVVQRREGDRKVLWIVVAGIVVANALLVALLLRKPAAVPVAEPVRIESTTAPPPPVESALGAPPGAGSADATAATAERTGAADPTSPAPTAGSAVAAGPNAAAGSNAGGALGANATGLASGSNAPTIGFPNVGKPGPASSNPAKPAEAAGTAKPTGLPKGGIPRPHKKLP